jgi:GDP-L-fucose synthase
VEIWGTGNPLREFLWSEDMADACVFLMENINFSDLRKDESQKRNFHINIGSGKEITIRSLADLIKNTIGYNGDIVFNNDKPDGTMRKLTDVTKLRTLGWKHSVAIDEGIARLITWYKETLV